MNVAVKLLEQFVIFSGHVAWPVIIFTGMCLVRKDLRAVTRAIASRISDPRFDVELSKDGMKSKLNDLEQRTEEVENQLEQEKQQNQIDLKALEQVDIQLSETILPKFSSQELIELILKASPLALEYIYQKTKEVRHAAWKEHKKGLMERTIPIFQALVRSEHGSKRHRYYAQLGYALKDQADPEWRAAKSNLEKAIQLWQREGTDRPLSPFYAFNWVMCAVELDNHQHPEDGSDLQAIKQIVARIEASADCEMLTKALRENTAIQKWLKRNAHLVSASILQLAYLSGDCHREPYLLEVNTH
jgi:hypothetical protein